MRWPLISLPLPNRPGQMVDFDLLGPLPTTAKGNAYVFLVWIYLADTRRHTRLRKRRKLRKVALHG